MNMAGLSRVVVVIGVVVTSTIFGMKPQVHYKTLLRVRWGTVRSYRNMGTPTMFYNELWLFAMVYVVGVVTACTGNQAAAIHYRTL